MTKPGTANPRAGMPLSNVRVLDIATMGAGPLAARRRARGLGYRCEWERCSSPVE